MAPLIKTEDLTKEFRNPLTLKKITALTSLNLTLEQGEVFGYLGPNGAGKTTTFKLLLGLISPTRGQVYLWGKPGAPVDLKAGIGFLPESPYFYTFLRAGEYLHFCGRLFGIRGGERKRRVDSLLELVGLADKANLMLRNFSKGMLQRLGLAQALINNPELLLLDEPMSGLDPLGRKEVRDIILQLKREGKTILFSSHILSDVEMICDQVGILLNGRLKDCGPLRSLLNPKIKSYELHLQNLSKEETSEMAERGISLLEKGEDIFLSVKEEGVSQILTHVLDRGGKVMSVTPLRETLEDLYVSEARSTRTTGQR